MAFSPKTDYCGLAALFPTNNELAVRDDTVNESQQEYAPDGADGATIGIEVYGEDASPTNNYALMGDITAAANLVALGKVTSITTGSGSTAVTKKYRLKSVKITTAANQPVKVSAASELVNESYTDSNAKNFGVPAFSLSTDHLAQILFGAFTVTGTNANLMSADYDIALSVSKDKLVGNIISNGAGSAAITCNGTILVKGDEVPVVAVTSNSGWVITKRPTCTNPETAYKSYSFTVKKALPKGIVVAGE